MTALLTLLPSAPAQAAAENATFSGTISSEWDITYTWEQAGYSERHTGMATYEDLERVDGSTGYSADVSVGGTNVNDYWAQGCRETTSFQRAGRYGPPQDPWGAVDLSLEADGVHFMPNLLWMDSVATSTCPGASDHRSPRTEGGFVSGESWSVLLRGDTDPASDRLAGTVTWTLADPPGGRELPSAITAYSFTLTYDLTVQSGCAGGVQQSYDAFRARVSGSQEPHLHYDVTTQWCTEADGSVLVLSTEADGITLQSPLAAAIDAGIAELFSYRDVWRSSTTSVAAGGREVVASGNWEHCLGIPLLGKVKWVKKSPEALRYVARLLHQVDGKHDEAAERLAKLMKRAARAVEWAIETATKPAKWAARQAVNLLGKAIYAMGERRQTKILLITVGAIADYSSSAAWARNFLTSIPQTLIEEGDPLGRFLSAEVCFRGWKPRIRQPLGTPGAEGAYVDRAGDYDGWSVARHAGAF